MASNQTKSSKKAYTLQTTVLANGRELSVYRLNGKPVKTPEVPEEVVTALSVLDSGAYVDEKGQEVEAPKKAKEADEKDAPEAPVAPEGETVSPVNPTTQSQPQGMPSDIDTDDDVDDDSGIDDDPTLAANKQVAAEEDEGGMGFPRKNGKTVDIFDGKTPHTHVRYVANIMVPLKKENYENKTDGEIIERLQKLGKI